MAKNMFGLFIMCICVPELLNCTQRAEESQRAVLHRHALGQQSLQIQEAERARGKG